MEDSMTSQTSSSTGWRRAATGVVASGLVVGMLATAPIALSEPAPVDPANPATPAAAAPGSPITAGGADAPEAAANDAAAGDKALAEIAAQYDTGNGGGQIAKLIHSVMLLRSQGFYPSKGNVIALQEGLAKRPNQVPLREALEQTLSFQRRNMQRGMAQQEAQSNGGGINQIPPRNPGPIPGDNDDDDDGGISIGPFG
jgi:hypothetical protein